MSKLAAGASTQSRANRPLPADLKQGVVVQRLATKEVWQIGAEKRSFLTWVFDQGGPLLGYTSPRNYFTRRIIKEVKKAMDLGMYGPGSVASNYEHMVADMMCQVLEPFLTDGKGDLAVRWFANGSDACCAAVRLARAVTRRNKYISIGYHGSSVVFAHKPQRGGVPDYITKDRIDVEWGDINAINTLENKVACVIVEAPSDDAIASEFLEAIRAFCDVQGAVMIMDELVTGFRLSIGGGAQYYDIAPDLACYGKAMSNGRGIAALVGWEKIMNQLQKKVFYSNTFNGDPLNLAFVKGTLATLVGAEQDYYPRIWQLGELLRLQMESAGVNMIGHAPRMDMQWKTQKERREFCERMAQRGVIADRPFYISVAHTEDDIALTGEMAYEVIQEMSK